MEDKQPPPKNEQKTTRELPPTSGAHQIVMTNTYWAAGSGLIPVPLVDFMAITALQLKMIRELTAYYQLEFQQERAKAAVTALISGTATPLLAYGPVSAVLKALPVVGQTLGALSATLVGGSLTYAVGKVFTLHFGSGGTLMDFDPERFRDYFLAQVEAGKEAIRQKTGRSSAPEAPHAEP